MQNQFSHSRSYAPQIHHLSGRSPHPVAHYPTSPPQNSIPHFPTSLPPSQRARPVFNYFQPAGLPVYPRALTGRPHRAREYTNVPTPIFSSASRHSPASPHQPSWVAGQSSSYSPHSFNLSKSLYSCGEELVPHRGIYGGRLTGEPEESKNQQRESSKCPSNRLPTEKRATTGDATTDGVPRGPVAKKIFLGIERKGKELKRQISGEVRKLAGGSKCSKRADPNVKSFLPRMERKNREEYRIRSIQTETEQNIPNQMRAHTCHVFGEDFDASGKVYSRNGRMRSDDKEKSIGTKDNPRQISGSSQFHESIHDNPTAAYHSQSLNQVHSKISSNVTISTGIRRSSIGAEQLAAHPIIENATKLPSSYSREIPLRDNSADELRVKLLGPDFFHMKYPKHYKSANIDLDSNRQEDSKPFNANCNWVQPTAESKNTDNNRVVQNKIVSNDLTTKSRAPSALEFWTEADSTLSSAPPNFYDEYYSSPNSFWADADKMVQVPLWKKHGQSLEEWIASLPGVGDGAVDSKFFQTKNKLKKKKTEPGIGVLRVVNGEVDDEDGNSLDKDGNEVTTEAHENNDLPAVAVDSPLLHPLDLLNFPRPFEPGGMEILQEASRETSLHTPTVMGGVSAKQKYSHLGQANAAEPSDIENGLRNVFNIPLPTEKILRPADLAKEVSKRLEALEQHWDEQGLTAGTVLKRMLRIVDTMVVKEREEGQRERRAQEMGWTE